MRLTLRHELMFTTMTVVHRGVEIVVADVLVDTGAASTVVNADVVAAGGLVPEPDDVLRALRGVGGREHVFVRRLERLVVGGVAVAPFEVEVGEMDYGITMGGILGMDYLRAVGAVVDVGALHLRSRGAPQDTR